MRLLWRNGFHRLRVGRDIVETLPRLYPADLEGFGTSAREKLSQRAGHPLRTTISEMGPLMLSRLLDLNDTQEGVLLLLATKVTW